MNWLSMNAFPKALAFSNNKYFLIFPKALAFSNNKYFLIPLNALNL